MIANILSAITKYFVEDICCDLWFEVGLTLYRPFEVIQNQRSYEITAETSAVILHVK